jgi:hypothetical protein
MFDEATRFVAHATTLLRKCSNRRIRFEGMALDGFSMSVTTSPLRKGRRGGTAGIKQTIQFVILEAL